jgi:hypothetical protein
MVIPWYTCQTWSYYYTTDASGSKLAQGMQAVWTAVVEKYAIHAKL